MRVPAFATLLLHFLLVIFPPFYRILINRVVKFSTCKIKSFDDCCKKKEKKLLDTKRVQCTYSELNVIWPHSFQSVELASTFSYWSKVGSGGPNIFCPIHPPWKKNRCIGYFFFSVLHIANCADPDPNPQALPKKMIRHVNLFLYFYPGFSFLF